MTSFHFGHSALHHFVNRKMKKPIQKAPVHTESSRFWRDCLFSSLFSTYRWVRWNDSSPKTAQSLEWKHSFLKVYFSIVRTSPCFPVCCPRTQVKGAIWESFPSLCTHREIGNACKFQRMYWKSQCIQLSWAIERNLSFYTLTKPSFFDQ